MPFGIQPIHIVIIVVIALLIFGPKSLPEWDAGSADRCPNFAKDTRDDDRFARRNERGQAEEQKNTIASRYRRSPFRQYTSANKFCTKCGAPNPSDALFCNKCGNPFQVQYKSGKEAPAPKRSKAELNHWIHFYV